MSIDKVAVVTGAASGIGRATTELFVERGYGVVAVDLDDSSLTWCANHERIVSFAGDIAEDSTNEAMVTAAVDRWGRLDVAILNAGVAGTRPFEADGAIERFDQVMAINVRGVALGIRYAAPAIRASGGGAIVATASTSGLRGDPGRWAYNTSKAAVINLVRAAALDYAAQGIRINAIAPGPTESGLTRKLIDLPDASDSMTRRVPMQRWGMAREIAEAMWFLASPAASFITGVTLPVDGGLSANAGHFDLPRLD